MPAAFPVTREGSIIGFWKGQPQAGRTLFLEQSGVRLEVTLGFALSGQSGVHREAR